MNYNLEDSTPIAMLTLGQLRTILREEQPGKQPITATPNEANTYIYGLRGIRQLFGVSHATAQKLKDGILLPAVKQCGRKIIVDAEQAVELFNTHKK